MVGKPRGHALRVRALTTIDPSRTVVAPAVGGDVERLLGREPATPSSFLASQR